MRFVALRVVGRGFSRHIEPFHRVCEVSSGADPELSIHLAQVVVDGVDTEEHLRGDLRVGCRVGGESGGLSLLRSEVGDGPGCAPADFRSGRCELGTRTRREALPAHGCERVVRGSELYPRVDRSLLAAEPLPVGAPRLCERSQRCTKSWSTDPFAATS
jgi:hypothetical protein